MFEDLETNRLRAGIEKIICDGMDFSPPDLMQMGNGSFLFLKRRAGHPVTGMTLGISPTHNHYYRHAVGFELGF
jgi:hypothetical protein